jgi:hypothetical protein
MKPMEQTVLRTKCILADMFECNINVFETNYTRAKNVVEARRFLTYFLYNELKIKYTDIPRYIPALSNHATAIHHCRKLEWYLDTEKETEIKYIQFKEMVVNDSCLSVEKEIQQLNIQRQIIKKQITKLKQLI